MSTVVTPSAEKSELTLRQLARPVQSALEVLAANGVETVIQREDGVTPTPVNSAVSVGWIQETATNDIAARL